MTKYFFLTKIAVIGCDIDIKKNKVWNLAISCFAICSRFIETGDLIVSTYCISDIHGDYDKIFYNDKCLVIGHYPTRAIDNNPKPDYIYKANHHIAIDCDCGYGGQLGAICLDNGKEFYI